MLVIFQFSDQEHSYVNIVKQLQKDDLASM